MCVPEEEIIEKNVPLYPFSRKSQKMQSISLYQFRLFLLFTIFFCGAGKLYAQPAIYPVQLHVQLLPPFTPCLFDYINDDFTRLRVIALQRDMRENEYRFSLQFTVKQGNSVKLQSKPFEINYENNFKVQPGIATTISGRQLSNIFKSIENKGKSLCLKEGHYELVFQAIDTKTNMPISEPTATFVYFQQGQPPYPISPADGSCIKENMPVNFSWVDQTASMSSNKRYKLEIFELRDDVSPQNIAESKEPDIEKDNILVSFFSMQQTAGNFQKNKRYAWRVQTLNTKNGYNQAAIKNNGYSEMFFFDYGTCINPFDALLAKSKEEDKKVKTLTEDIPELLRIDTTNISASAVWKNEQKYNHFLVEYRRKDTLMERDWVVQNSLIEGKTAVADEAADSLLLNGITQEVTYEVRVQGCFKDGKFSQYSNVLEFKLTRDEKKPECGNPLPPLNSKEKIASLQKDDVIIANGYKVTVTEVTKNNDGTFSGYGKVDAPLLKVLPLRVKFDNITVNDKSELMNGKIVTVYNLATSATFDLNGVLNKESRGKLLNEQGATIPKVDDPSKHPNSVVQDTEGNVYVVDSEGNATKVGKIDNNIAIEKNSRSFNLGEVKFSVDQQNMPFDKEADAFKGKGFIEEHYETLKENYQVPWTLVPTGQMREIKAEISKALSGYQPSNVKFVCTDNVILESKYNTDDKTYTISVFGGDERTSQGVYAVVQESAGSKNYMTLGKILLAHYTEKTLDVVIVPVVNRSDVETGRAPSLQDELNKIYNPIGVKVNVTIDEKFVVNSETGLDLSKGLNVQDIGTWERETEEMRTLQRLYAQSGRELKKGTVYLFALEKSNPANVQGDMPRDKRTGYIFGNEINNARLIAHELGHGAFTLEHTFNYGVEEKSTDNLMDYSDGSFLTCWQWYIAHNQNFVWSFMEGDEDAMSQIATFFPVHLSDRVWDEYFTGVGAAGTINPWDYNSSYAHYVTPGNQIITLPLSAYPAFTGRTNIKQIDDNLALGCLLGFHIDGSLYRARFNSSKQFIGYVRVDAEGKMIINAEGKPVFYQTTYDAVSGGIVLIGVESSSNPDKRGNCIVDMKVCSDYRTEPFRANEMKPRDIVTEPELLKAAKTGFWTLSTKGLLCKCWEEITIPTGEKWKNSGKKTVLGQWLSLNERDIKKLVVEKSGKKVEYNGLQYGKYFNMDWVTSAERGRYTIYQLVSGDYLLIDKNFPERNEPIYYFSKNLRDWNEINIEDYKNRCVPCQPIGSNTILFVNGYDLSRMNSETDNVIVTNDRHKYWEGIDIEFISRLKSRKIYYADGHMDISTSNHNDMTSFYCSARSTIDKWPSGFKEKALKYGVDGVSILLGKEWILVAVETRCYGSALNTKANETGFNRRKNEGREGGKNLSYHLQQDGFFIAGDTLDIVCHSMGFAYALGMIEYLKETMPNIKLGGFYIIAPENPCSGEVNVDDFIEIWQYGSNEKTHPTHKQDGVAPQCAVKNLIEIPNKSGRAYIPDNLEEQGFVSSHSIGNYMWIFKLRTIDKGYVTPRK